MDTKFAKASILGKVSLQPFRNHSVVRQPNALESERPRISKPWFASQVDVKNDLSKTVTPHYLPKVIESMFAKPRHEITHGSSRNSSKESYASVVSPVPVVVTSKPTDSIGTPSTALLDQDAPSSSTLQTTQQSQSQDIPLGVAEETCDIEVAYMNNDPLYGILISEPDYEKSFSMDVIPTNVHSKNPPS
uniref:Integrase, catalytic region, zinc finger, CCHC-type, peptidase aspartic, catalytic n=1 Tax=Tanacetum cinerariifolium TaxID=118510 RepID=A0A699HAM1_TANCI|nr:hypothetical protein [Tanacetum cinerariifolium]